MDGTVSFKFVEHFCKKFEKISDFDEFISSGSKNNPKIIRYHSGDYLVCYGNKLSLGKPIVRIFYGFPYLVQKIFLMISM